MPAYYDSVCVSVHGRPDPTLSIIYPDRSNTGKYGGHQGGFSQQTFTQQIDKLWLQFLYFAQYAMFENQIVAIIAANTTKVCCH